MKFIVAFLALVSTATAFAPAAKQSTSTALSAVDLSTLPGSTPPLKNFDPLGYSKVGTDETFNWFRAAELKHGRVAMLASTGFLVQAAGFTFPGYLSMSGDGITFDSFAGMNPVDQWAALPDASKYQIFFAIFLAEGYQELQKPHYMMGGPLPELIWPKVDTSGISPERLAVSQGRELNNGRLAMIAIMSFLSEKAIPGSVPALKGIEIFH